MDELKRLEDIAKNSIYGQGMSMLSVQYSGQLFLKHMVRGSVLELGPAEGIMTEMLYPKYKHDYTAVDGSELFIEQLKKRHSEIKVYTSLFEDFAPNRKYSNIILGHVLEHVIDPVAILKLCKGWLEEGGRILAAVPNANSIHRQVGLKMGMLEKLNSFSEKDYRHGHRRVFFRDEFAECFVKAGLSIAEFGGYFLKPLSDAQIEKEFTAEMIEVFMYLGEKYPEISGEMYIIAQHDEKVAT